jgi:methionine-rich copper-binding protein CopC
MFRKNIRHTLGVLGLAGALSLGVSQAEAHAQLVSAEPAADETVATPEMIVLHFNEPLEVRVSSMKLTDIDGAEVATMSMPASDDKSLAAMPVSPLAPGLYTVSWTAVGDDGHPMPGTLSFTVK